MQNQLTVQQLNYILVPEAAKKSFENAVWNWYELSVEKEGNPLIRNNMFFEDTAARDWMLDLLGDISDYLYAKDQRLNFNPDIFPVKKEDWNCYHWDTAQEKWANASSHLEFLYFIDMKVLMDHQKMFFVDQSSVDGWSILSKPTYRNMPFGEVW